jgi:PBP1b-binding outer membrane lipoprotein LpoB
MKKQTKYKLIVIIGGVILASCANDTTSTPEAIVTDTTNLSVQNTVSNPHDLILIDNQKWVIDEGMRVSIDSIDWRLKAFNGVTLEDYKVLSTDLSLHTKTIISSCTMQGQAHDELHKWLIPFINLRKELDSISDPTQGQEITAKLTNEITIFKTYFK